MERERWRKNGILIAEDIGMSSVPGDTRVILTVDDPDCCELEEDFIRLCCLSVPAGPSGPDWNRVFQKDWSIRQNLLQETVNLLCQRLLKHEGKKAALRLQDSVDLKPLICHRMQNFHGWEGDDLESNFRAEFEEEMELLLSQVNEFIDEDMDQESEEMSQTDLIERCIRFCTSGLTSSGICDQFSEIAKSASEETCQVPPPRNEQENGLQTEAESSALKILSKFPLGLGLDALIGQLKRFLPVHNALEEEKLKWHLCQSPLLKVFSNDKYSVVLPNINLRSMDDIERSLYTLIQLVVKVCNASVPVAELPSRLENMLGIRFSTSQWGISCPEEFYQHLIDAWGLNDLIIAKSKRDGSTMEVSRNCIQWICSSMKKNDWSRLDDQSIWCSKPLRRPPDGPVPQDFVSLDHSVASIADMIEPEKVYLVRPDFMVSPIQFYVSMLENAELRDIFVDEMTKFYNRWKNDLHGRVRPQIIQEGSLVAVKHDNQWHRGLVMGVSRRGSRPRLAVNLFDIGECVEKVSCRNVFPVHKDFAHEPQQTFMCRLPPKELDKYFHISAGKKWFTKSALEDFYDILQDKVIAIIPHRRVHEDNCWEVSVLLTEDSSAGKNYIVGDLLTMFVAQQCGHDDDDDEIQEKNSTCVKDVSQQSPCGYSRSRHEDNPANLPIRGHSACRGRGWGSYPRRPVCGRQ